MLTHPNFTNVAYEPTQGYFFRVKQSSEDLGIIRRLLPDEDNNITAIDPQGKTVKRKAHNLAWIIAKGEIPEGYLEIAKNRITNAIVNKSLDTIDKSQNV